MATMGTRSLEQSLWLKMYLEWRTITPSVLGLVAEVFAEVVLFLCLSAAELAQEGDNAGGVLLYLAEGMCCGLCSSADGCKRVEASNVVAGV